MGGYKVNGTADGLLLDHREDGGPKRSTPHAGWMFLRHSPLLPKQVLNLNLVMKSDISILLMKNPHFHRPDYYPGRTAPPIFERPFERLSNKAHSEIAEAIAK